MFRKGFKKPDLFDKPGFWIIFDPLCQGATLEPNINESTSNNREQKIYQK
ncbi:hypothetical protein MICAF_1780003 [Microcystis aeruginosa PCC 9807]|uniref:Uncharacterized protein n=1 Tax=Microcystis aeruginosa PCC 9807 TaxID=1160283 RepID=I4H266_MICAE|nr:hypothetical protein MICAF_1780003 [Microcystis aeruginosa PCC 9807]